MNVEFGAVVHHSVSGAKATSRHQPASQHVVEREKREALERAKQARIRKLEWLRLHDYGAYAVELLTGHP